MKAPNLLMYVACDISSLSFDSCKSGPRPELYSGFNITMPSQGSTATDSMGNRVTICLPNMFKSFLVTDPVVNPHYEAIRAESEGWLQR